MFFTSILKSGEKVIGTVGGIALVFMNFSFDSFSSGVKVGIVDSDQSKSSQFLIKILEENKQYKVTLYDSYEKALI